MSNIAYTPVSKLEEHAEDSPPTYPTSPQTHAGSSDVVPYPPPSAQDTQLPENLCSYIIMSLSGVDSFVCQRGSSKEDIIDKLSSVSPGVLSGTPLDKIVIQICVDGDWITVPDSIFHDAIIRGRPNKIRIFIKPSWKGFWHSYGLITTCFVVFFIVLFTSLALFT